MSFDVFGDFNTRGYLQNLNGDKNSELVKVAEHNEFRVNAPKAMAFLSLQPHLAYKDFLKVHEILFADYYPTWAGKDRQMLFPDMGVTKGSVIFADPPSVRAAIEAGLRKGQDKAYFVKHPGEVMEHFAYGHPFLDGNGRTMLLVHTELCRRAGFSLDWASSPKQGYLAALTQELESPGKGILDRYLLPLAGPAESIDTLLKVILRIDGLDGTDSENRIAGYLTDPAVAAMYKDRNAQRQYAYARFSEAPSESDHAQQFLTIHITDMETQAFIDLGREAELSRIFQVASNLDRLDAVLEGPSETIQDANGVEVGLMTIGVASHQTPGPGQLHAVVRVTSRDSLSQALQQCASALSEGDSAWVIRDKAEALMAKMAYRDPPSAAFVLPTGKMDLQAAHTSNRLFVLADRHSFGFLTEGTKRYVITLGAYDLTQEKSGRGVLTDAAGIRGDEIELPRGRIVTMPDDELASVLRVAQEEVGLEAHEAKFSNPSHISQP